MRWVVLLAALLAACHFNPTPTPTFSQIESTEGLRHCHDPLTGFWTFECPNGVHYTRWSSVPILVYGEDGLMKEHAADVIEVWNDWLGFELLRYHDDPETADILIIKGGSNDWFHGVALMYYSETRQYCGAVIYNSALFKPDVITHEVGHCLGLQHDSDKRSIMATGKRVVPWLQDRDRMYLTHLYKKN